ncbi:MAG: methyltransferase [Solirubrobacteraceae bacterium]
MSTDKPSAENRRVLGQRMVDLLNGYQVSAAIGAIARLGVADCLSAGPAPLDEVAARVGADAHSLGRVVRLLADVGIFEQLDGGRVGLTALGGMLRDGVPGSARRGAIVVSEEWHWRAYGHFAHTLLTGEPGFRQAHGCGFWEYLERHPQASGLISDSMSAAASFIAAAFVRSYDFGGIDQLVDVGGGHGMLMRAVLDAHPQLQGAVLDLPGVIEGTRARLADWGLTDRCEAIAGDFFEAVPAGGDAYVLSWILHDWDDQSAVRILANCHAAMGDAGRLLAIELVVPSGEQQASPDVDWLVKTTDVEMLAVVGGRERTAAEYGELYTSAGFQLTRIVPLKPLAWSVIEGSPS